MIASYAATNGWVGSWSRVSKKKSSYKIKSFGADYTVKATCAFPIAQILYHGKVKQLCRPIFVSIAEKGGYTQIDCKELNIYSAGRTYQDAFSSFSEDFSFAVDLYVNGDPRTMTKDAIALRDRLSSMLGSGETQK